MVDEVQRVGIPGKEGIDVGALHGISEEIVEIPMGKRRKRQGFIPHACVHLHHMVDLGI